MMNRGYIRNLLRETFTITEKKAKKEKNSEEGEEKKISGKYSVVQKLLNNPIFNHSAVIKDVYGTKDATHRSSFRKKLNQEEEKIKDSDGNTSEYTHLFDEEELDKILSVLRSLNVELNQTLTSKEKK